MNATPPHIARVPRIAITPGEPAGIGPDLCVALAQRAHGAERVAAVPLCAPTRAGVLDAANAAYVLDTLRRGAEGCVDTEFDALVTGPVHKGVINDAGVEFSGHTEFLADLTHTPQVVMMLLTEGLRVALATTHLPLRDVADAVTAPHLTGVLRILHRDLHTRFSITSPRSACSTGSATSRSSVPRWPPSPAWGLSTQTTLRGEGMDLVGPLPADTLFIPKYLDTAVAVLAMYHVQGLPVLIFKGFGKAVNITLGLPIVRTSVDHGTALELAGKGGADTGSLVAALQLACDITARSAA